ncbi:MAG: amino acid adenylation domain-containing protein, partial [Flavobacteriales bacterium]|nr:amino acid adenylation domain-containing protein [Flavobacteriales bacterium]
TLFMVGLAAVKGLIYRYTNQTDIIVGTGLAGRDHVELEDQIGYYLNTLALRSRFDHNYSFGQLLATIKEVTLKAYQYQAFPFDELIGSLSLKHDLSRSALFDVSVVLQNTDLTPANGKEATALNNVEVSGFESEGNQNSKFDLSFTYEEIDGQLYTTLVYNSDIYSNEYAERMLVHLKNFFATVTQEVSTPLVNINYLTADEERQILSEFNNTKRPLEEKATVIDLFEKQVLIAPDAIAIITDGKEISYQNLNDQANQLANYLVTNYHIVPDDIVAIRQENRLSMLVSILATLKAGGAYLPIASDFPEKRIDFMIEDSKCKAVIDDDEYDMFHISRSRFSKTNLNKNIDGADLVYVIYTSGSNGEPKGVMVEHKALLNLCSWHGITFNITNKDRSSLYLGVAFDAAVSEIFPYLVKGACLVEVPSEMRLDVVKMNQYFETHQVTMSALTTQVAEQFVELDNAYLKYLIVGGDKFNFVREKSYKIVNQYGPTENTVVTANYILEKGQQFPVPIGKPIFNVETYVLDAFNKPLPVGTVGELCIGGASLSRGYLNNEKLNAKKFIQHPFKPNERLYRTGDLCKWRFDGNIEFVERIDDQVKIRGFRIELGEIETALNNLAVVSKSVVLAKLDSHGEKCLVAYFIATDEIPVNQLRSELKKILPEFMIPQYYLQLDEIPLTENGKLNKAKLPDPDGFEMFSNTRYVAPKTDTEEKLVVLWKEVLGKEKIGIEDDFFELGGNSLKATRLISKVNKEFTIDVDLRSLFEEPKIRFLAEKIDTDKWLSGEENLEDLVEIKI